MKEYWISNIYLCLYKFFENIVIQVAIIVVIMHHSILSKYNKMIYLPNAF